MTDGTWLQLQLWSLNHVGWEARSRLIPACQPAPLSLWCCRVYHIPAIGLCICLCWINYIPKHPVSCLPRPAVWIAAWPSSMPIAPSGWSCELVEISLHSPFLVLAEVLNYIGSSLSGFLAGFYSAGQNPLTSQVSTHFMFQLSSWHPISLVTKRLLERMPKDLLASKYAISSCLITGCRSQTLMKRPLERGAVLIQPHSLYFGTSLAGISGCHWAWREHRLLFFCTVIHADQFFSTSTQTACSQRKKTR